MRDPLKHYVKTRAEQLREEADKCTDHDTRMWLYKTAQELEWVVDYVARQQNKTL